MSGEIPDYVQVVRKWKQCDIAFRCREAVITDDPKMRLYTLKITHNFSSSRVYKYRINRYAVYSA